MEVSMPPPSVPRCSVANSRMRLRFPMRSWEGSPLYFRSWGATPIVEYGNTTLSSPMVKRPSIKT